MRPVLLFVLFPIISCVNSDEINQREPWKTESFINESQILLTNDFQFGEAYSYGASSFLIESESGLPVLCTAKHLLGEDMGILPEISTNDFDNKLTFWSAYPRTNKLSNDTVKVVRILNKQTSATDIILLELEEGTTTNLLTLKPRLTKVKIGENLEIIGCEYADMSCFQKSYSAKMNAYETDGMLIIYPEQKFAPSGFSGAPVIDENGLAVGVISGGGYFGEKFQLWVEPLTKVQNFLK